MVSTLGVLLCSLPSLIGPAPALSQGRVVVRAGPPLSQQVRVLEFAPAGPQQGRPSFADQDVAPRRFQTRSAPPASDPQPGRLGIAIQSVEGGVRIDAVMEGSAAARGALREGDVVLGFEGQPISSAQELIDRVRGRSAGAEIQLRVRHTARLRLEPDRRTPDGRPALGVYLGAGPDDLVVSRVEAGYPAARAELRAGDRIVAVAGQSLRDYDSLVRCMQVQHGAEPIDVVVERDLRLRLDAVAEEQLDRSGIPSVARRPFPVRPPAGPPPEAARMTSEFERELAAEVRALTEDLRALRGELAELRASIPARRRRR